MLDARHEPRQHRSVAHSGVKNLKSGRRRFDLTQFASCAGGENGLFVARVDERQILLAIVVETKRDRWVRGSRGPLVAQAPNGALGGDVHSVVPLQVPLRNAADGTQPSEPEEIERWDRSYSWCK